MAEEDEVDGLPVQGPMRKKGHLASDYQEEKTYRWRMNRMLPGRSDAAERGHPGCHGSRNLSRGLHIFNKPSYFFVHFVKL